MEKLERDMLNKIIYKIDHLEEMINGVLIENAKRGKDIDSNSRHILKAEGAIEALGKLIRINKESILMNSVSIKNISVKQKNMNDNLVDINDTNNINWIKTLGKYVPNIMIIGIISLMFAEPSLRKMFHH